MAIPRRRPPPSSVSHPTQSRHKNGIDGTVPSHDDAEIGSTVPYSRRRIGHFRPGRRQQNIMGRADFALSDSVLPNTHDDRPRHGVNLDRRMRGVRDGDVSGRTEQGLDLASSAAHLDSVEYASRAETSEGRENV